jgi:hypothetical protein
MDEVAGAVVHLLEGDDHGAVLELDGSSEKDAGRKKPVSFGKRVVESSLIKKTLLIIYNWIFKTYYQ